MYPRQHHFQHIGELFQAGFRIPVGLLAEELGDFGYLPQAFDAAVEAAEPDGVGAPVPAEEMEPFCRTCGAPVGLFPAYGLEYVHYHRGRLTDGPRSYRTDHPLRLGWRYLADALRAGV